MGWSAAAWARTLLVVAVMGTGPAAAETPSRLGFGLVSVQSSQDLVAIWSPVVQALQDHLGMPVTAEVAADYAGVIWKMRANQVGVAWFGNKSAIEAVDNAGAEVFAQTLQTDGSAGYRSLLVVATESPLRNVDDMFARAGELTFGYGDANSTSGYLVPSYYLFGRKGVQAERIFKRVMRGNHEDNLTAVANGTADAATVSSASMERILKRHPELDGRVRVLWQSPMIPANPMLWRKDLPDEMKQRILAFFLDYGAPRDGKPAERLAAERAALARIALSGFIGSDNGQLLPVRQIELYRARLLVEADATLAAEEKARRLADVDRRLGEIEHALASAGD